MVFTKLIRLSWLQKLIMFMAITSWPRILLSLLLGALFNVVGSRSEPYMLQETNIIKALNFQQNPFLRVETKANNCHINTQKRFFFFFPQIRGFCFPISSLHQIIKIQLIIPYSTWYIHSLNKQYSN
jgi:hypothetical protein